MSETIAIYLKAPSIGQKAKICAQQIPRAGSKKEGDFQASAKELAPGDQCRFRIYNSTMGVSSFVIVAGPWIGDGCRISQKFILGDRGDTLSAGYGLYYDTTNRKPCTAVECCFDGNGLLQFTDSVGTTLSLDTTWDAASCLFLAVGYNVSTDSCTVNVEFRDNSFGPFSVAY